MYFLEEMESLVVLDDCSCATFLMNVGYVADSESMMVACDCAGNVLDECGVCGGEGTS